MKKNNFQFHFKDLIDKQYLIPIIVFLAMLVVGLQSLERSVWVDEAMIFVNILNIEYSFLLEPLPYFKQASPAIPLLVQKAINVFVGNDFYYFRLLSLVISMSLLLVFYRLLPENFPKNMWFLVFSLTVYPFLYYATEIKHYSFEFTASLFIILSFISYFEKEDIKGFILSLFGLFLGFSNIIPLGIMIGFIFLLRVFRGEVNKAFIYKMIASSFILVAYYLYIKFVTVEQVGISVYASRGLGEDLNILWEAIIQVHGNILALLTLMFLCFNLFFLRTEQSLLYYFSVFYLLMSITIIFLKITGVYPVLTGRHIYWLAPFSITLCALSMNFILQKTKLNGVILILFAGFASYSFYNNSIDYISRAEHTANNLLLSKASDLCDMAGNNLIGAPITDQVFYSYKGNYNDTCFSSHVDISRSPFEKQLDTRLELYDESKNNYLVFTHFSIHNKKHPRNIILDRVLKKKAMKYNIFYENKRVLILSLHKQPQ